MGDSNCFEPNKHVVLNVDDDDAKRYIVSRILKNAGYAVIEAIDGESAIAASETKPSLIILDVRLPDMTGYDVCRMMKLNPVTGSIPVLHLSASFVDNDHKALGLNLGADGYLTHPVAPNVLLATVKALIRAHDAEARARKSAAALEEAYREQKRIAETLQRSLLMNLREDGFDGFKVATVYEAAWVQASVGGDFYDACKMPNGKMFLVVGDATGKGLAAAAHTAEVKFALRAYLFEHEDPSTALFHLNNFLCDTNADSKDTDSLVALAVCLVDVKTSIATFSCASMEPPAVLRANLDVETISAAGLPVGAHKQAEYVNDTKQLELGDTIVMTTDGITEARNGRAFLSYEGMIELAKKNLPDVGSLEASAKKIIDAAREFANGKFQDDVCMLLARRTQ